MSGFGFTLGGLNMGAGFGGRFGSLPVLQFSVAAMQPGIIMPLQAAIAPATVSSPTLNSIFGSLQTQATNIPVTVSSPTLNSIFGGLSTQAATAPATVSSSPTLNAIFSGLMSNGTAPAAGAQLWSQLEAVGGMPGYITSFALGYWFAKMDAADGNGIVDQNELAASAAMNGTSLPLPAPMTADAFRNFFAQRDFNRDGLWNRDEFDGKIGAPGVLGGVLGPSAQPGPADNASPQPPQSGQPPAPNPDATMPGSQPDAASAPEQPAPPADSPQSTQTSQQNPPDTPSSSPNSQPDAGNTGTGDEHTPQPEPATSDGTTPDKDDATVKDVAGKKPELAQRMSALVVAADANGNGMEEEEFTQLAKSLGLKSTYADFRKARGTKLSDEAAMLKLAGIDGEVDKTPAAKNPAQKETAAADTEAQQPETQPAQNTQTPMGKPNYFSINTNKRHGVEKNELTTFISKFSSTKSEGKAALLAADIKKMVKDLEWEKARYGRLFVPQLLKVKDSMTAEAIVKLMFDSLDHDKGKKGKKGERLNWGLVRGELGDLVQKKSRKTSKVKNRK